MTVQLEFIGHACFRLWEDGRPTVVMDPYTHSAVFLTDDGGQLEGQTVIVSSLTDPAHDNVKLVQGQPKVINALDVAQHRATATVNNEWVVAVEAAEIPDHPEGTDPNALYAVYAGGLWFAHMGDLGFGLRKHELDPFLGKCDVLLALVGEWLTLSLDDLDSMIEFLKPKWLVPMHYALPPVSGGMSTVDRFLQRHPRFPVLVTRHHTVTFPLPVSPHGHPTIVVLEPSGYQATGGLPEFHCSAGPVNFTDSSTASSDGLGESRED